MAYDIVIVSHKNDFYKIKFVVESLVRNLIFDEIHLILSDEFNEKEKLESLTSKPIFYHHENDILQIDKSRIKYRPNWIYQMLLKIFQNVTKNDNFLIVESDIVINSKLNFFKNDKTIFYLGWNQNNIPYYNFNQKILNIGREYDHSFIVEFMMYNKNVVKDLLTKSNCNNINDFLELVYENVDIDCYPADYELYGNFCMKYYKEYYDVKKINVTQNRMSGDWSELQIRNFMNMSYDVVSFHSYK